MTDIMERLWPAFISETTEKILELELLLVGVPSDEVDVHGVFRAMHTIKGGCAMMGFSSMEALAHAAEDLMEPIRRGVAAIDESLIDLLLEVVDALKAQLGEVNAERREPAPCPQLVDRLRRRLGQFDSRDSAGAGAGVSASNQHELVMAKEFCSAVAPILPALLEALVAGKPAPKKMQTVLVRAADVAGYPALSALAKMLAAEQKMTALAALLERVAGLEKLSGGDAGCETCYQVCRPLFADALFSGAADMLVRIRALEAAPKDAAAMEAVLTCLREMQLLMVMTGASASLALYRLLAQLLRDAQRGLVDLSAALMQHFCAAAVAPLELDHSLFESDAYHQHCDALLQALGRVVDEESGRRSGTSVRDLLQQTLSIRAAALDAMSPAVLEQLWALVQKQVAIYEVAVDLEARSADSARLVHWFDSEFQLLTSYTFPATVAADGGGQRARVGFVISAGESAGLLEAGLQKFRDSGVPCSWVNCSLADSRLVETDSVPMAPAAPQTSSAGPESVTASTLRVDSDVLDRFVGRVGEMVTLRNAMSHSQHDDDLMRRLRLLRGKLAGNGKAITLQSEELPAIRELLQEIDLRIDGLMQADARFQGALSRLQEDVLALRVVPIATVFNRLPRLVRDVAQGSGKQVDTELEGDDVRIDKSMVEALLEPLMHLVRNSVDHGIEAPALRLSAGKSERGRIIIRANQHAGLLEIDIEDDGAGLDIDRIRRKALSSGMRTDQQIQAMSKDDLIALVFEPGFSTAEQVTEVSGRGVGMDVVRNRVQHLGGTIAVESEVGRGTRFRLRLPLSLAIQNVVLVRAGSQNLALPERYVGEVIALHHAMVQSVQGQAACLLRGATLPLFRLSTLLGQTGAGHGTEREEIEALVISDGSHRIGLIVDAVLGRPEVFIREVHPDIAKMPGISGVSILGDGQVVIILDCDALIGLAAGNAQSLRSLLKAS